MCDIDSADYKTPRELKLCCSYFGWCATEDVHCKDPEPSVGKTYVYNSAHVDAVANLLQTMSGRLWFLCNQALTIVRYRVWHIKRPPDRILPRMEHPRAPVRQGHAAPDQYSGAYSSALRICHLPSRDISDDANEFRCYPSVRRVHWAQAQWFADLDCDRWCKYPFPSIFESLRRYSDHSTTRALRRIMHIATWYHQKTTAGNSFYHSSTL